MGDHAVVTEEDNIGNGGRISLYTDERWYLSMVTVPVVVFLCSLLDSFFLIFDHFGIIFSLSFFVLLFSTCLLELLLLRTPARSFSLSISWLSLMMSSFLPDFEDRYLVT